MQTDAKAESSTAKVQFDNWDEKGTPIVSKVVTPPKQESAPVKTSDDNAESRTDDVETETAEESATSDTQERKPHRGTPAPKRNEQLKAEIQELEALLAKRKALKTEVEADSKSDVKTAASSTATPAELPKRPNPFKWTGTPEEFEAAQEKWEQHQAQKAVTDFQQTQAKQAAENKWLQTVNDYRQKYADFDSKVEPVSKTLSELPDLVKAWFPRSENAMDVLYMLSGSQELMDKLVAVAKSDPYDAINKLAEMKRDVVAAMKKEPKAEPEPKTESKETPRTETARSETAFRSRGQRYSPGR